MEDYEEILSADEVYQKYKFLIPSSEIKFDEIIEKLKCFYRINEDCSLDGNAFAQYQSNKGKLYRIGPNIPVSTLDYNILLYVDENNNLINIHTSDPLNPMFEKITDEITLLRGLTAKELECKELVYNYIETVKRYYHL